MKLFEDIKEALSEYDPRLKRMVLSSKRVCGCLSHFICLAVLTYVTFRDGVTELSKPLWEVEIVGTLALLGITQFGKFLGGKKDESE